MKDKNYKIDKNYSLSYEKVISTFLSTNVRFIKSPSQYTFSCIPHQNETRFVRMIPFETISKTSFRYHYLYDK